MPNVDLARLRLNAGLSPNQLGRRAGVSGASVRSAEAGRYVEPTTQRRLADALGTSVLELFPMERQRPLTGSGKR